MIQTNGTVWHKGHGEVLLYAGCDCVNCKKPPKHTIQEQENGSQSDRYKFTCTCGYASQHPKLSEALREASTHQC